jgi:hypothetical protein
MLMPDKGAQYGLSALSWLADSYSARIQCSFTDLSDPSAALRGLWVEVMTNLELTTRRGLLTLGILAGGALSAGHEQDHAVAKRQSKRKGCRREETHLPFGTVLSERTTLRESILLRHLSVPVLMCQSVGRGWVH